MDFRVVKGLADGIIKEMEQTFDRPTTRIDRGNSDERLRELIIYVSEKCQGDTCFGAIMLNKILFFSDFLAYSHYGEPITGVEYRALPNGPAPLRLVQNRKLLIDNGDIELISIPYPRGTQQRVVPIRTHKSSFFTDRELKLVDAVIAQLRGTPADAVSEISHGPSWRSAMASGELIPYETAFVSSGKPTKEDIEWAQSEVEVGA